MKNRILSIFLLLLLFTYIPKNVSAGAYKYNLSGLISDIRSLARDNTSYPRWNDAKLTRIINAIQNDVVGKTYCLQSRTYYDVHASTREYALPTDCMKVLRLAFYVSGSTDTPSTAVYKKLQWTSIGGQDYSLNTWQTQTGQPQNYYLRGEYFGLGKRPTSAYQIPNGIQFDYLVIPSSLTASTSIPFNDTPSLYVYHQAIIYGVLALYYWEVGNVTEMGAADAKYKEYIQAIKDYINYEPDKNPNMVK